MLSSTLIRIGNKYYNHDGNVWKCYKMLSNDSGKLPINISDMTGLVKFDEAPIISFHNKSQVFDLKELKVRPLMKVDYMTSLGQNYFTLSPDMDKISGFLKKHILNPTTFVNVISTILTSKHGEVKGNRIAFDSTATGVCRFFLTMFSDHYNTLDYIEGSVRISDHCKFVKLFNFISVENGNALISLRDHYSGSSDIEVIYVGSEVSSLTGFRLIKGTGESLDEVQNITKIIGEVLSAMCLMCESK